MDQSIRETTSYKDGRAISVARRTGDVFIPPHLAHDPLDDAPERGNLSERQVVRKAKARKSKRDANRRKKKKSRRARRIAVITAAAILLIWLFLRLAAVPFGSLIVEGNDSMSTEEVYRAGRVPGYVNVVQLSPQEMQAQLQHDLRIGSVSVEREFPATIRITMAERKPAAIVTTMYGFAYVDKEGTVIDLQPQIKGVSVPLMTGKKVDTLLLGDEVADELLRAGLAYLQSLHPDVLRRIAEINVGNPNNIIAYTSDSIAIYLGKGDHPGERAVITGELLEEIKNSHLSVQYIDTNISAPSLKQK